MSLHLSKTSKVVFVTVEGKRENLFLINLDRYPYFEVSLKRFKRIALQSSIKRPCILGRDEESQVDTRSDEVVLLDGIFKITHIYYNTAADKFLLDLVDSKQVPIEFVRKSRARIHLEPECDDNPGYGEVVKADALVGSFIM